MNLTNKEKDIVFMAFELLRKHYEDLENKVRVFKWICNVPQHGEEYEKNINIFELQDKAIEEFKQAVQESRELVNKITRD